MTPSPRLIVLTELLPHAAVAQDRPPTLRQAVRQLLAAEPGLSAVAQGRIPTRDEVAALHTTCQAVVFAAERQIPDALRDAVARWLDGATREVGHPTPARVHTESIALAHALLAFAAPVEAREKDLPARTAQRALTPSLEEGPQQ